MEGDILGTGGVEKRRCRNFSRESGILDFEGRMFFLLLVECLSDWVLAA